MSPTLTSMSTLGPIIAMVLMTFQGPAPPRPAGSIRSLDKGIDSQMDAARQAVVRTAVEWEALWRLHGGERTRPAVDFGKEVVVAVFLGSRPTAGFSVEIVGVREDGSVLVVQYRETRPPAGAIAAQILTMPYHIVAVPRSAAATDVKFEKIN